MGLGFLPGASRHRPQTNPMSTDAIIEIMTKTVTEDTRAVMSPSCMPLDLPSAC